MNAPAKGETAWAVAFLLKWSLEGPWVLTAIQTDRKGIETRTFHAAQKGEMQKWIAAYNGKRNLYFHVNPVLRDLSRKAGREDIKEVAWLHVDIDPRPGEDIREEQVRARKLLESPPEGVPRPTVIVYSGGGFQGFWKLEEPIPVNGHLAAAEEAARYNRELERIFGGDQCHNIDRIMRLPGTVNIPDAKKLKKGRVATLAEEVEFNTERVYPLSVFRASPDVQIADETGFLAGSITAHPTNVRRLASLDELDEWSVPDRVKVIIVQGNHPDEGPKAQDNSRSSWLFDVLCSMARCSVPPEVMFAIITDPSLLISESVLEKRQNAEKYAWRQIKRALEEAVHPKLRELNERHAVIRNIGGKCRIVEEQYDYTMKRPRLTRQSFDDFRNAYMHIKIECGRDANNQPRFAPLGKWWLEHPQRRQFDSIVFAPGQEVEGAYNLWRGFACEAIPGDCTPFLDHIERNLCRGNKEIYNYIVGWMASAVQRPDSPGQVAIVLRGRRGTGKSFMAKAFGSLFGRHFMQVSDPKHLVGSFNAHLRDCVVLFGDEAFFAGDKKHESVLKTLITEEVLSIEAKGIDVESSPNYVHLLLASNSNWVVPAGADERRFLVLDMADDHMQDLEYFGRLSKHMNSGGREALLDYLLKYDLSQYEVRQVPQTAGLKDQKLLSLSPEEEWWYNRLVDGNATEITQGWPAEVMKREVLEDYLTYMRRFNISRRGNATTLGRFMAHICPNLKSIQRMASVNVPTADGYVLSIKRREYFYIMPTLAECRAKWEEHYGAEDWSGTSAPIGDDEDDYNYEEVE